MKKLGAIMEIFEENYWEGGTYKHRKQIVINGVVVFDSYYTDSDDEEGKIMFGVVSSAIKHNFEKCQSKAEVRIIDSPYARQ